MAKKKRTISPLYVHDRPKSTVSEKFRGIRSNIMFSSAEKEVQSLLITSEKPGSGKSTISANIAATYAQAGYKTLIIDGDMRKPTQHYIFDLPNNSGLSNLIINKSTYGESIKETKVENLAILTAGPTPPNPSELIASNHFNGIYNELLNDYDFIVIDTPPVNTVTDAQVYAQTIQNCALVIDAEKNNKNEVKKAKDLINKAGGKLMGAILNKTAIDKSSSYYYYYGDE
ncbi:polysaccharide biosynthesis tyrosine autokinase [Staphylococcus nepalensis]|uniref:non-specific protein-tyrosine kinase n=1 Tax=Staphylococcus nepalensis TaxID=214473 RepID=A0ABS3KZN9_9STAP|nr:polysaccharide biosynthesis tyrosine autokinase [Staphylococcus nepalensis]MBO1214466.1 polysaccharide biosynthesis tyrosine autokinase [Staphylococcus nepalensis]MBO1216238.1 polysaccharide biosynthesis tyrosine autokinase [Staphylococcus nepalensis]MBO1226755.1 polysaccharide biosynthesis tyrosine autokinase [Staphylococcus nepalensis]MBO1233385.1 polysaccharide biosynthesis tyrosine autokinase [Staphylococcus nepalensis]MBO1237217.1 polysaccharide biosynthesis tyrosine autokinase [Staphy